MAALRLPLSLFLSVLAVVLAWSPPARAVSVGLIDNFEDGTTQGWQIGAAGGSSPARPQYLADGGPGGAGDGFVRVASTGSFGPAGRLTMFNLVQWSGNYLAQGVGAITLDVNNLGATDLVLRLLISDPYPGSPANSFMTEGASVPAGSGWTAIAFSIAPQDLIRYTGTVDAALSGAVELRLFHAPAAFFPGPMSVATLGVDNIRALAQIPEPGSGLLFAAGLLALASLRRTRLRGRCTPGGAASR